MVLIGVLLLSLSLQIIAAFMAIRLIHTIGGRAVWMALSLAILLMSVRRFLSLSNAISQYPTQVNRLDVELVALLISVLILTAVALIKPLIDRIKLGERQLDEQTQRNRIILQTSPDGFLVSDLSGNIQETNDSFCKLSGYRKNVVLKSNVRAFFIENFDANRKTWRGITTGNTEIRLETRLTKKNGDPIAIAITAKQAEFSGENFIYLFVHDLSEKNMVEVELARQRESAQVTLESIGDGVITTDIDGNIQYMNPVAEALTGSTSDAAAGRPFVSVVKLVQEEKPDEIIDPTIICMKKNRHSVFSDHILLVTGDNDNHFVKVVVSPLHDENKSVVGSVTVMHNVSELKHLSKNLSYQASHDLLTGLINRRHFETRLEAALSSAEKYNLEHALCYMDLDQFKVINDTCGHTAGDELLKQLASVLQGTVREADTLARLGGDEFGVLLEVCTLDQAKRGVDAIFSAIRAFRFQWDNRVFEIGLSIGLVPITKDSGNLTDILSAADSACYVAKERGRNCVYIAVENDQDLLHRRGQMEWLQYLRQALRDDRFQLYGQSIKPLNEKTDAWHIEILLRMVGIDGQLILPNEFMPVAERYDMMSTIDQWVVKNVFAWMHTTESVNASDHRMVAINLSGQSISDNTFLDYVESQFDQHSICGDRICFEITETAVISNILQASKFIAALKIRGCKFALDDFGSGLSSFKYLKDLDVDYLKIDGSFIRSIHQDENSYNMVVSINNIGQVMGLKTIAEFVENIEIQKILETIGVDFIQGYAVDEPYPVIVDHALSGVPPRQKSPSRA